MTNINPTQSGYSSLYYRSERPSIQSVPELPDHKELYENLTPEQQRSFIIGVEDGVNAKQEEFKQQLDKAWQLDLTMAKNQHQKAMFEAYVGDVDNGHEQFTSDKHETATLAYLDIQQEALSFKRDVLKLKYKGKAPLDIQELLLHEREQSKQMQAYHEKYYQKGDVLNISA